MKTQLLSFVVLSSALLVSACTPPDLAVTTLAECEKIRNCNSGPRGAELRAAAAKSKSQSGSEDEFPLKNFPLSAFLVERQIEVVELIKLAAGTADPIKTQFKVDRAGSDEARNVEKVFINQATQIEYSNNDQDWKTNNSRSFEAAFRLEDDLLSFVEVVRKGAGKSTADSKSKKRNYVNVFDNTYELTANVGSADAAILNVDVVIAGNMSGATGGKNILHDPIKIKMNMKIDRASLATDVVSVINSTVNMTYPGIRGKIFNSDLVEGRFVINYSGLCSFAKGSIKATAGPKNTYNVLVDAEGIQIENKNWSRPWAECGKRPVLDLGRFLNP